MTLINFLKPENQLEKGGRTEAPAQVVVTEPVQTCPNCRKETPLNRLRANQMVCSCGKHLRMNARDRLEITVDPGSFREMFSDVTAGNPLYFPGYTEKIEKVRAASGESEGVICGYASIQRQPCMIFVMEPSFLMGSMGTAVGEKITLLFEYALSRRLPVIGFTLSGGARMQEGLLSLMQMAKTSAAVKRHGDAGLLYIAVLTDPTTGGVTASFAMEADIILAEPGATIGFAGARVIEQTTKESLPKGFQTAEFVLEHGFIDAIVSRREARRKLGALLKLHA